MSLRRKILLGLLGLVLLVPTGVVYFIATTESGLQFVARRLGKLGPVTVTMGEVRGTLVDGFSIATLRVQHRRADVHVDRFESRIELLPLLLTQRIRMPKTHIGRAAVRVFPSDDNKRTWDPHFLPASMRIDAASVRIDQALITARNGRVVQLDNLIASATVLPKQIRAQSAEVDLMGMHFVAKGRVLAARPLGIEAEARILYRPEGLPEWQIEGSVDGNLDKLPIDARIQRPFRAEVKGDALTLTSGWHFAGHGVVHDFDLAPFGGGRALGIISGELDLTAASSGYTARGNLTAPGLKAGPMAVTFDGSYAAKHLQIRSATVAHAASGARASVSGTADIVRGGPQLDLDGQWTQFRWPLAADTPAFSSTRGSFTLAGLKPWTVQAEGLVSAAGLTDLPTSIKGALASTDIRIDSAQAELLGGTATFTGNATWQPAETWQIAGRMASLDTSTLRPDLPGQLGFDFEASGAPFGAGGAIDFDLRKLSGRLRGQVASGRGHFALPAGSQDWQFRGVDLRFGRTHVELNGGLGARRDLTFAVDAEDLSLLDPEARGRLSARGRYAGTADRPVLLFKARGSDFQWRGSTLASLNADVDIDLATGRRTQGQVELTNLTVAGRTAQKVALTLSGSTGAQRIVASMEAAPLRGTLSAEGVVADGLWQGHVSSLSVTDAQNLSLKLVAPAPLRFSAQEAMLQELCLTGMAERFCASGTRDSAGPWRARFSATALPLRMLTAGLTQDMAYEGIINVAGEAAGAPGIHETGTLRAQLVDAQLRHQLGNGREERMPLGSGSVTALATTDGFSAQVELDAGDSGHIRGQLTGQRNTEDWRDHPIRGSLEASTTGLGLLDIYVGGIDRASGRIATNVNIGGTLGTPSVDGTLQLREAQIDVYQVNLSLRALQLDARFNASALELSGQTQVGNGRASFNGRLAWRDREPYGNLHVEGENLRLVDVPEARIEASPKLDFKLEGRRIEANGEVRVPRGRLEPADLTNAVLASGDEVLVGAPPVDPAMRWIVVSNIRLTLGEDVNINSLGLTAKLGGSIVLRTDESQISRGQGELNVVSGKYAALGRQLDVQRGRLIFNNGPLGDPGIDLRAQKVFPDVTAGVNVRGSLRAPRMSFFSEPAIPQSQIASLILAGGSLESLQNSNNPGAARNDLLAQGGAILAQQIGSRVGIQDVGLESNSFAQNQTSLVLGRYLSPHIYISYGISLAEAINTLKLRYTIGDHWTIKTEAGQERSADIVYTVRNPKLGKKKKAATPAATPDAAARPAP
jgi:translocation and assembly module TamB